MSPYSPFLLPLAVPSGHPYRSSEVNTTLEEEAVLLKSRQTVCLNWDGLAERIRKTYGLPLLVKESPPVRIRRPTFALSRQSPDRCLLVEMDGAEWFVLEHPSALSVYDTYACGSQFPALAMPSLFARWINGGEQQDPPLESSGKEDSASLSAFWEFLGNLTRGGAPSDWHLEPGRESFVSRLRLDGHLLNQETMSSGKGQWLVNSIIGLAALDKIPRGKPLEGAFSMNCPNHGTLQLRVSMIPALHGYASVVRFLYPRDSRAELTQLGFTSEQSKSLLDAFASNEGLWVVAGPTGAGKTTTLHALLQLSVHANEKALAIEDPVESTIPGVQHLQVGQPRGLSFAKAIRSFMRQAPDCILVGEIRDRETASIAIQASRTGHRVLSSLHARDTTGALGRFSDLEQEEGDVTAVCEVLIHQRLIPLLCRKCRREASLNPQISSIGRACGLHIPPSTFRSIGCPACQGGYSGRTGLYSIGKMDRVASAGTLLPEISMGHLWQWPYRSGLSHFLPAGKDPAELCALPSVRILLIKGPSAIPFRVINTLTPQ